LCPYSFFAMQQKNVRQKNEEDQTHSSFFCLTFFGLVADRSRRSPSTGAAGGVLVAPNSAA
jgi:hypothetical protein